MKERLQPASLRQVSIKKIVQDNRILHYSVTASYTHLIHFISKK